MTEREKIAEKIRKNEDKIKELEAANTLLRREDFLLCDDKQWFTEEVMSVGKRRKVDKLVGFVCWNQDFVDEDTDEVFTVVRRRLVRVDGVWTEDL
jgi:predicted ABC-type ATPase